MILLIPLVVTTLTVRLVAGALVQRGVRRAVPWSRWSDAVAAGMAAMFVSAGATHFIEPQRSGLVAIVPDGVSAPELAVTVTGLAEFVIAVGLVVPRTRRWAGVAAALLLVALLPANIVAAAGVAHPAAPTTPLVPRVFVQLVFIACSLAPACVHLRRSAHEAGGHQAHRG